MKYVKSRKNRITALCAAAFALFYVLCACTENTRPTESFSESGQSVPAEPTGTAELTAGSTSASEQTAAEEHTAEEQTTSDEKTVFSAELVLATFNIKHGAEGLDKIAAAISEISPDIIGLEEVDVRCGRSGNVDEPAELARLAGYPYYAFAKAIPLGGGEYGTALLSRYPIESFEVIPLGSGSGEVRSVGHAVIRVEGLKIDVLVTHLTYEDRSVRIAQMETIGKMLQSYDCYILLGDLNSFDLKDISYLGGAYCVNRPDRRYSTFRRYEAFSPDNIVVSDGFTELSSGMSDTECSDHNLLYATFLLSGSRSGSE